MKGYCLGESSRTLYGRKKDSVKENSRVDDIMGERMVRRG